MRPEVGSNRAKQNKWYAFLTDGQWTYKYFSITSLIVVVTIAKKKKNIAKTKGARVRCNGNLLLFVKVPN